jgi:hypothetical protein
MINWTGIVLRYISDYQLFIIYKFNYGSDLRLCLYCIYRSLLAYLFIPLLQKELDVFKNTVWNTHRIRHQKDTYLPDGVPNHVYEFPEVYGLEECGMLLEW